MKYLILFLLFFSTLVIKAQTFKELNDSLIYHYQAQRFEQAIPFAEKVVVFVKENYGEENKIYNTYLGMLASLYISTQQLQKAAPLLLQSNNLNNKLFGEKSKEYIKGITLLAIVYSGMGQDDKAIPLLTNAMEYYKNTGGETDPEYAASQNKLAKVYESFGLYDKAEPLFISAVEIRKKINGAESLEYATTINNLGLLYKNKGKPEKAEPLLLTAMQIRKKISGENGSDYANSLNNLAVFYAALGQNEKAENYYKKATAVFKNNNGEESAEYITSLANLGSLYDNMFQYKEAQITLLEALALAEKTFNEEWPVRENILRSLGQLYLSTEQYKKAESLLLQVLSAEERKNDSSTVYAGVVNDLAYLYKKTGRLPEAEKLYLKSAAILKSASGSLDAAYATALNNLADLYRESGRYSEAVSLMSETGKAEVFNLLNLFSVLSEAEKSNYLANNFFLQQNNLYLLYKYPAVPDSFYRETYNLQLLMKALLLSDSKNVLQYIRSSKDTAVQSVFNKWETNKAVLAKEYSLPDIKRRSDLKAIEEETEGLEKNLVRLSSAFRKLRERNTIKITDVQKNLGEDEAAIEFVSFKIVNNGAADKTNYAAFILRKNDTVPQFVQLCDEQQLQQLLDSAGKTTTSRVKNFYRVFEMKNRGVTSFGRELYKLVWAPLEPYLKGIRRISYSPAGKLYSIAFHALPVDSNTLLIDKYDLQQYTSTRQAAMRTEENQPAKPGSIVLFGDADFSMDSIALIKLRTNNSVTEKISTSIYRPQTRGGGGGVWNNLPGTAREVKKISDLFIQNKRTAKSFTQRLASEKNLKALSGNSPQVLHIATHGFFLTEPDKRKTGFTQGNTYSLANNPLLRSGLILSGGNYAWGGKIPIDGVEDGIATAYEIAQLNFSNTELVVLSACETALGDVKGSEGVFGLQRAFKMAGVKKMIVSLWKVPDAETAELMTTFYTYWMKGKNINESFAQAQADMRKKYTPFYWAAFVLVE